MHTELRYIVYKPGSRHEGEREQAYRILFMICMTDVISTWFIMAQPAAPPDAIIDLLGRFERRRDPPFTGRDELIGLWRDFIDPFFVSLGWDMQDATGPDRVRGAYARHLRVTTRDRATYSACSFGENGIPQFLVVLEKPSAWIRDGGGAVFRLRRYAWNAEIPLLIVTNFTECVIYDCSRMPEPRDDDPEACIACFTYRDYPSEWNWITSLFSKEALIGGSIRDYAVKAAATRGSSGIAEVFLRDLESWRETLAKNIANGNHTITTDELNDAVYQTIYQVIFLQICRERGINPTETLLKHLNGTNTPWLVDDTPVAEMIGRFSGPAGPYELSAIPLSTLAAIFDIFFKKTVRMRGGHYSVIEVKAGGRDPGMISPPAPRFVVDYIVRHTVDDLAGYRAPQEITRLRILDPSCGAGLFLIGMYQGLLDWHLEWYRTRFIPDLSMSLPSQLPVNGLPLPPGEFPAGEGWVEGNAIPVYNPCHDDDPDIRCGWRLTFGEKTRILLNNIYGVDIDRQAVGVTILLLILHLIKDEDGTTPDLSCILEYVITTLRNHIRCGNSLVGPDYFDLGQTHPYHYREEKKVNPFTWHTAFPEVMEQGGFDALIGNPPSVIPDFTREQKVYFQTHYSVYRVTTDLTPYFIEKGISLLTRGGILSLWVSDAWLRAGYGKPLRKYLINRQIVEITDFGVGMHDLTGSCILRVSNTSPAYPFRASKVQNPGYTDLAEYVRFHGHPVDQAMLNDGGWTLEDTRTVYIIGKLRSAGKPLEEYVMGQLTRGAGSRFPAAVVIDEQTKKRLVGEDPGQSSLLKPFLRAKDIHRYARPRPDHYLIQMPEGWTRSHADEIPDPVKWLLEQCPVISRHPAQFRTAGRSGSGNQDLLCERRMQDRSLFPVQARIISPSHAEKPSFTLDAGIALADEQITIISYPDLYLLGILNSKATEFFIRLTNPKNNDRYSVYSPRSLSRIPVYTPDFDNPVDRDRHDRIELLVAHRLDLQEQLMEMTEEHEHGFVQKEIEATEGAIDEAIYTIYGLTQEERIIINKETAGYRG